MENTEDEDCVYEPRVVKLTPYDRRLKELRDLQAKRDAISNSADSQHRLATLDHLILRAERRFEEEKKRAIDEDWRKRRNIDDWRAGEGRALRNATRRKVRALPNESLAHLTEAEKEQRKRDQRADANFRKRLEAKGVPAEDIQAALKARKESRIEDRKNVSTEPNPLENHPDFGRF